MRENPSCKASLVRGSTSALMYIHVHVRVCGFTQAPMCSAVVFIQVSFDMCCAVKL